MAMRMPYRRPGTPISPLRESGLRFVEGIKGRAVYIGGAADAGKKEASFLQYDARKLFDGPAGTVCFWFKPDWDGGTGSDGRFLVTGEDGQAKNIFNLWFWTWLRADLPRKDLSSVMMNRRFRPAVFRGDWMHLALVWPETGWTKLFVDGVPYRHGGPPPDELPMRLTSLDMRAIHTFCVGSGVSIPPGQNGGGAFDDLKIYRRALSDDEVVSEYRRGVPIDMVMDRTTLFADKEENLEILIAPGGHYVRPAVAAQPPGKADVELTFELTDNESGRAQLTRQMQLAVETAQSLQLSVGRLSRERIV